MYIRKFFLTCTVHKKTFFLPDGKNKGKPWPGFKWPVVVAGAPEAGIPRVSCPQETLSFPPFIQAGGGGGRGDWLVLWETFLKSVLESMGNIWWLVPNRSAGSSKVKVWVIWLLGSNPTEGFLKETISLDGKQCRWFLCVFLLSLVISQICLTRFGAGEGKPLLFSNTFV
jgi:hypothetical protein